MKKMIFAFILLIVFITPVNSLVVSKDLAIDNKYVVVRKGKKKYFLGEFIGE